jgi:hypothetical protein
LTGLILLAMALLAPVSPAQMTDLNGCMQDIAQFGLNCTANDVQVARATNIEIIDDGCAYPGDTVTFRATFEVLLTAQGRHDIGLYFAVDGDTNADGAVSGQCSISTMAFAPDPPWLDLDGTADGGFCANDSRISCTSDRDCRAVGGTCALTQDLCGDIDADHNPLSPVIEITTQCIDPDGNGILNLPNCTSWRQPGANELCLEPVDAFPGSPSKCRCDPGFEVDILVPPAELAVVKTATPTSLDEPGGVVEFAVSVTNQSPFANVAVDSLLDDVYGDITVVAGNIQGTDCAVPQLLGPGATYSCSFQAGVSGNGGTTQVDVVTASGVDENANPISGSDDASVAIIDLMPAIQVVKTASPTQVLEPGGNVTYIFTVNNLSVADVVTITSLTDSILGNLDGLGSCSVPQSIAVGGSYLCSVTTFVGGSPGDVVVNVLTVAGSDEEGNPVGGSDSASVNVNDVPSAIELVKVASPTSVNEPGGLVTFTFTVNNLSAVDTVTITSLTDSLYGDLNGQGTCSAPQTIVPGGSYTCSISANVAGNAGDAVINVATAAGLDDDGNPVSDDGDATVNLNDVPPSASLTKTATAVVATFTVVVTNDSAAEALSVDALIDDRFGDITAVQGNVLVTDCAVPQVLAAKGTPGDTYTCAFDALVETSPHVDTVTGTISDDDGNAIDRSDSAQVTFE